ncbi:MAP6 domain-containing protein 1 isoform X2 [Electrophorus electricus]|uniref:MAP6 domain-containing protein 1 isoform X2 n=1 Tax=Electrophorus electricus TaxID=8005 RepID=UPI000F0A692D|nr:MAP6 domain-containing protein 1 isoform X2 [Electrophorus electricus]
MAWPCISRVCCLARFWNEFDKSDLSVPLTIQNYSDISEHEVRSVTKHVIAERAPSSDSVSAPQDGGGARPCRGRPREDYRPPGVPFPSVTQYKQDYKPWPIPKKDNFPWISNGGSASGAHAPSPGNSSYSGRRAEKEERVSQQKHAEETVDVTSTSSYRQEFRPWAGVRPPRPAQKKPAFLGTGSSVLPPETSYRAAFSADAHRPLDDAAHAQHGSHAEPGGRTEEMFIYS